MMLRDHWGYIWGTSGETWTEAKQKAATREMTVKYGSRWIGHRVADCSGVMVYIWRQHGMSIYHGSNTIRRQYCEPVQKDPKPGYAAFKVKNGDDYHHIGIVAADGLNVYESKGTQTGFVMSAASSWDCFAAFKDVAYVSSDEDKQGGDAVIYQAEVTTKSGGLNIRSGPGEQYSVIGRMAKGEIVDVLEEQDGWAHIIDGKEGWSSMTYLTRIPEKTPETEPTDDRPNETVTKEKWIVVIPCESEEEARRYAGNIKNAVIARYEKPPDAIEGE